MRLTVDMSGKNCAAGWHRLLVCQLALLSAITACRQSDLPSQRLTHSTWRAQTVWTNTARAAGPQPQGKSRQKTKSPARAPAPSIPAVVPVIECRGVVVLVNEQSRFVVADFSFNPVPQPGQRLGLFRNGQRVGEVRTSSFSRGGLVAADILSGDARTNDEVRLE